MATIICYIIIYFVEAFILWHYCTTMFQSKYSKCIEWISIVPLYLILLYIMLYENILLNFTAFLIANFIYIIFAFHTKWLSALFHASITTAVMGLSEVIVANIIPNVAYNFFDKDTHLQKLIIIALYSKILYYVLLQIIISLFGTSKEKLVTSTGTRFLIVIPVITVWIIFTLLSICSVTEFTPAIERMITTSALLLLIINFFTFSIYRYNQEKEAEYREMQLQLQREYDASEYYQMLLQENENKSILIHDIKNHLQSISTLNKQKECQKVDKYIEKLINSSSLQTSIRVCDNDMLNAIICRYKSSCAEKGITLYTDIRSKCIDFLYVDDLTALICNLLDNAVESAILVPDSYIELRINRGEDNPYTTITMLNFCNENPFSTGGKLFTRKPNKTLHGFGMKSIERIANKYGGYMSTRYNAEDKTFCTFVLLKNES